MPIAHHHLHAIVDSRRAPSVRIDGFSYPVTSRGSIHAGALRRRPFVRRRPARSSGS